MTRSSGMVDLSIQILYPRLHDFPPSLEQARTKVRSLDALNDVSQAGFGDFPGDVRLGAPIVKRRSHAVNDRRDTVLPEQFRERVVGQCSPCHGWKDQTRVASGPAGLGQHLQRPPTQRNAMLAPCLRALGGYGPSGALDIDFRPLGMPNLSRPYCCQSQELDRGDGCTVRAGRQHFKHLKAVTRDSCLVIRDPKT